MLPSFMFSKIKNYKLILINKYDASAKEYNPKRVMFIFTFIPVFFILLLIVLFFSTDLNKLISLKTIQIHKKNNIELQSVIEIQKHKINELKIEIDNLSKRDDNMRSLLKLPLIDQDIRKLGIGGSSDNDKFNHIEYLLPGKVNLDVISNEIDFLLRTINLEKLSYSEIENKITAELHQDFFQGPEFRGCKLKGTDGIISWNSINNEIKFYNNRTKKWQIIMKLKNFEKNQMYIDEIQNFLKCVKNRKKTINDLQDGINTMNIALAIKKSARHKKIIELN